MGRSRIIAANNNFLHRGMFRVFRVALLLLALGLAECGTENYLLDGETKKITYTSTTISAEDVGFGAKYYKIIEPLFKLPNSFLGSQPYYEMRYLTSIYNVVAECLFFEATSCI